MKYASRLPLIAINATILDQEIFCTKKKYFVTAKYSQHSTVSYRDLSVNLTERWTTIKKKIQISPLYALPSPRSAILNYKSYKKSCWPGQHVEHCSEWAWETLVLHNTTHHSPHITNHTPQSITKIGKYPLNAELKCGGTSHSDLNSRLLTGRNIQTEGPTLN